MTVPMIGGPFAGQRHESTGDLIELPWVYEDCNGVICGTPGQAHTLAVRYRLETAARIVRGIETRTARYVLAGMRCLDGTVTDAQLTGPALLAAAAGLPAQRTA